MGSEFSETFETNGLKSANIYTYILIKDLHIVQRNYSTKISNEKFTDITTSSYSFLRLHIYSGLSKVFITILSLKPYCVCVCLRKISSVEFQVQRACIRRAVNVGKIFLTCSTSEQKHVKKN